MGRLPRMAQRLFLGLSLMACMPLSSGPALASAPKPGKCYGFMSVVPSESRILASVKGYRVSGIDSTLGAESFESWLRGIVGRDAQISWQANDCGERSEGSGGFYPLCTEADCQLRYGGRVIISMMAGNSDHGLLGAPELWAGEIQGMGPPVVVDRLGDLPPALLASRALEMKSRPTTGPTLNDSIAIHFVVRIHARRMGDRLPDVPLGDWIARLAGDSSAVKWNLGICDPGGTRPNSGDTKDAWACTKVGFEDSTVRVTLNIRIGTFKTGLSDHPWANALIQDKREGHELTRFVSLEELPDILDSIRR